jgi:hypothetical protein
VAVERGTAMSKAKKTGEPPAWFKFRAAEHLLNVDVMDLTLEQEAIYLRLMCRCHVHGSIPKDPKLAARLVGKDSSPDSVESVFHLFNERDKNTLNLSWIEDDKKEFARKCKNNQKAALKRVEKMGRVINDAEGIDSNNGSGQRTLSERSANAQRRKNGRSANAQRTLSQKRREEERRGEKRRGFGGATGPGGLGELFVWLLEEGGSALESMTEETFAGAVQAAGMYGHARLKEALEEAAVAARCRESLDQPAAWLRRVLEKWAEKNGATPPGPEESVEARLKRRRKELFALDDSMENENRRNELKSEIHALERKLEGGGE